MLGKGSKFRISSNLLIPEAENFTLDSEFAFIPYYYIPWLLDQKHDKLARRLPALLSCIIVFLGAIFF